nr:MAG TPA: hypothetical protein [Caudoviricetes sp.]
MRLYLHIYYSFTSSSSKNENNLRFFTFLSGGFI